MQNGFVAALIATSLIFPVQNGQDSTSTQVHIRQVIQSLAPDSEMRRYLERGDRGDGVHYSWMDHMKEISVRRAKVFLDFKWSTSSRHPADVHVRRTAFYKSYDDNCSQLTDPEQLKLMEDVGLKRELELFAAAEVAKSPWHTIDGPQRATHGLAIVELFDDEWLPRFVPELMPLNTGHKPPILIDGDIVRLQDVLKSNRFSQHDLNGALFGAASYFDDPCSIRLLLSVGADPNSRNTDGETPLMMAAYVGHLRNVEALLNGGADASIKDVSGATAEDIALKREFLKVASTLKRKTHKKAGTDGTFSDLSAK